MNDMSATIIAKSDQINAADLIGHPITMTIREVQIKAAGTDDQPVSIYFEGENKAFRPCKGVRRLLVHAWGTDANNYIGQSLTLFCDPSVTWAGKEEGGIRVSHMTGIAKAFVFAMRTSRSATKPYEIKPLGDAPAPKQQRQNGGDDTLMRWAANYVGKVRACETIDDLNSFANDRAVKLDKLGSERPELYRDCIAALDARRQALSGADFADDLDDPNDGTLGPDNPTAQELREAIEAAPDMDALNEARERFDAAKPSLKGNDITALRTLIATRVNELS